MSDCIVLRKTDYEETSLIITVLAEDGVKSLMVKGAKKRNSMKLAISEPLTEVFINSTKSTKMATLIDGYVINSHDTLKSDIDRFTISSVILEYAYSLKDALIDYKRLFEVVKDTLTELETEKDPEITLFKFELILTDIIGIFPRSTHLKEAYGASNELLYSIKGLMVDDLSLVKHESLRRFFIEYFDREMGIKLKSKKLYINLKEV